MANITKVENPALVAQVVQRIRQRVDTLIGLGTILPEDVRFMKALSVEPSEEVIDDGVITPIPFTKIHWATYLAVIEGQIAAAEATGVMDACRSLQVRGLDVIMSGMATTGDATGLSPEAAILRNRIRPRARMLRALRYMANDDNRVMGVFLGKINDADTVDEDRNSENLSPILVSDIRKIVSFLALMISPAVNNEAVAEAIDAAVAGTPLEVR